jgi:phosphatidylglycerol:prolipoprotein diacylglycerol transferase
MIPYFSFPSYSFGPFTLEIFGVFAALGIFLGARLTVYWAQRMKLDPNPILEFTLWGVVLGILFGHLVHIFLYHPEELSDPWRILRVWDGLSSFGGLLGGVVGAVLYFRYRSLKISTYGDAFALGMAPGWAVARLGCFSVHDHPGVKTDFWLAVRFSDGPRHDLGFYDALWLGVISLVLYVLFKNNRMHNRLLAVLAVMYGIGRFFFDFLRASDLSYVDARYAGLTPAQYGCFVIVGWGVWQMVRKRTASSTA